MKPHNNRQSSPTSGTTPPEYVIIVAASEWSKEHDPANRFNLWDAVHTGEDRPPDPEPDLEAEP